MEDRLLFYAVAYAMFAALMVAIIISTSFINYQIKKSTMSNKERFDALQQRFDAATNEIAAELKGLKDIIKGGGLSSEDEEQVLARLEASAAKLEGLGKEEIPEEIPPAPGTGEEGTDTGTPTL